MIIKCPKCGNLVTDRMAECPSCGEILNAELKAAEEAAAREATAQAEAQEAAQEVVQEAAQVVEVAQEAEEEAAEAPAEIKEVVETVAETSPAEIPEAKPKETPTESAPATQTVPAAPMPAQAEPQKKKKSWKGLIWGTVAVLALAGILCLYTMAITRMGLDTIKIEVHFYTKPLETVAETTAQTAVADTTVTPTPAAK